MVGPASQCSSDILMEVPSLVVMALLKDKGNVSLHIIFKPSSQEIYTWLGAI